MSQRFGGKLQRRSADSITGMVQPSFPAARPVKPPISGGDLAVSVTALVATMLLGGGAAVFGLFSLVFLDYCPPESCSAEGAVQR